MLVTFFTAGNGRMMPFRDSLASLAASCAVFACGSASAQMPSDWVIVASNSEAGMGIDRQSLTRDGDLAAAIVLMGTFRVEHFQDGSKVQYYLSREAFRCDDRTRTELEVRMFGAAADLIGHVSPLEVDQPVLPGSLYDDVLIAACDGETGLGGRGFAEPLRAIEAERQKRIRDALPVDD